MQSLKGHIVVPYFFNTLSKKALREGVLLSTVFHSHLTIFGISRDDKNREELALITKDLLSQGISIQSFFTEKKQWKKLIHHFSSQHEVILYVFAHDGSKTQTGISVKRQLRQLRTQRIPYLWFYHELSAHHYAKVVITVGFEPREKEKILWATYFARRYGSSVHVVVPSVKDIFIKARVESNLQSLNKLYSNLSISWTVHHLEVNLNHLEKEGIEFAEKIQAGCFLHVATRNDFFNLFVYDQDLSLLKKAKHVPVLCINPRDDLYVLCQ